MITMRDLEVALEGHRHALVSYGLIDPDAGTVILHYASGAISLAWVSAGQTVLSDPPIGERYLGATKSAACAALMDRTRAIHDVLDRQDNHNSNLFGIYGGRK